MITREDYSFNAKWVDIVFIKEWIGWYDVVNPVGKKSSAKKYDGRYYECSGHGHPIFDITDYVGEKK